MKKISSLLLVCVLVALTACGKEEVENSGLTAIETPGTVNSETNTGDNSIGKSTFMLIIDYAFGGSTYAKATDILKNIGSHNIYFKFVFQKKEYYEYSLLQKYLSH